MECPVLMVRPNRNNLQARREPQQDSLSAFVSEKTRDESWTHDTAPCFKALLALRVMS